MEPRTPFEVLWSTLLPGSVLVIVALPVAAQVTSRASVDSGEVQGNGPSAFASISGDGRFVTFASAANDLVVGDMNPSGDIFVRDQVTGTTELVSVDSAETPANSASSTPSISADGRWVSFTSAATNLVAGDTNGKIDVFVRDRLAGTTERVSLSSSGAQANNDCDEQVISANGRFVVFRSFASTLVPGPQNGFRNIFVRDRVAGTTEMANLSSAGSMANETSSQPSVSAEGRYVAFVSLASNLVSGDMFGFFDVFVRDRVAGTTDRVSVDSGGGQGMGHSTYCSISGNGRYVAFESEDSFGSPDANSGYDIFVRDRVGGTTERVSVDSAGGGSDFGSFRPSISFDGRHVVFESEATNLVAGDANGKVDAFVHDRLTGATERMSVDSGGVEGDDHSWLATVSGNGRYVAFWGSSSNLVAGDTNGSGDAFVRDRFTTNLPSLCDPGVGGVIGCPCSNPPSGPGRGCNNHGSATGGAAMAGSGNASLAWDSVALSATNENTAALTLVWTGSNLISPPGAVHAAGVRCVSALHRLYSGNASGGVIVRPSGMDPSVSARSVAVGAAITAGQTRYYFTIYRDPHAAAPCGNAASAVNLSNVVRATWSP